MNGKVRQGPVEGGAPRAPHIPGALLWADAIAPGQSRSVAFFGRVK